jgi:hypothetical protein
VGTVLDASEKAIKVLHWFVDRYPAFWRWLIPNPPERKIVLQDEEDSAAVRNTRYWRGTWRWAGLLPLAYIFFVGNVFLPWSLAAFCTVILSISFLLARLYPIRRGPSDVSILREAACGTIWIWAVFLIPTILWKLIDMVDLAYPRTIERNLPFPRPSVVWYGLMCILFSVANWILLTRAYLKRS